VRIVVADTGPLNYLIVIEAIDLLPKLFQSVLIPQAVCAELRDPGASSAVRQWADRPPAWVDVRAASMAREPSWKSLDDGEAQALALARSVSADLILMDDRAGVAIATGEGFAVTGTLGVLALGARHGLIDLADAYARLKTTNFRYRPEIMDALLTQHSKRKA